MDTLVMQPKRSMFLKLLILAAVINLVLAYFLLWGGWDVNQSDRPVAFIVIALINTIFLSYFVRAVMFIGNRLVMDENEVVVKSWSGRKSIKAGQISGITIQKSEEGFEGGADPTGIFGFWEGTWNVIIGGGYRVEYAIMTANETFSGTIRSVSKDAFSRFVENSKNHPEIAFTMI